MFGYICVDKPQMKVCEYEAYKSVYCSLCKQLGKDYFLFSRFLLNYDLTFFALLIMASKEEKSCVKKGVCTFNPLKSCNYVCEKGEVKALEKSAALLVIMSYYKLLDNISDSGFIKRIGCALLLPYFSAVKRKAAKKYPKYLTLCDEMYHLQQKAEKENLSLDECAYPTANLLRSIFSLESPGEKLKVVYEELGYNLGRWIYIMDAAEDYEEDIKKKSFNPIYEMMKSGNEDYLTYANEVLSQAM
ncbi:MAG: DUF5685 family protein, partial [Eubacteriales bacterium]|nr:DUF5685 family protein [Eubacteriales bacterium]